MFEFVLDKNKYLKKSAIYVAGFFLIILLVLISYKIDFDLDHKNNNLINNISKNDLLKKPVKNVNVKNPLIYARAVYLIDADTKYPLYAKNEFTKVPIASTTKIATLITILENYPNRLNDVVTISPTMVSSKGSDIGLKRGEKISVKNLMYAMMIASANDAANSLAEYFGGKEKFVKEMNEKVKYIGLNDTTYNDPAGYDDQGLSTARDLAILTAYALKNPVFLEMINIQEKIVTSEDGKISHDFKNSNHLILDNDPYHYEYAIGGKTGFTFESGHSMVSIAKKDGHTIVSVVLNCNESTIFASAKESRKLLEWGFDNWTWK